MRIRNIVLCVLFASSVGYAADSLHVAFSRLDSLINAINMLYRLPPDTSGLGAASTPILTWNGTKWTVASGLTVSIGSGAFSGAAKRAAVYISGTASTDIFSVTWKHPTGSGDPADNGAPYVYGKTDSLIIFRATGTTSGLGFDYVRTK